MSAKKHNLTTHKDHITGTKGVDLFTGTKGELGSNDVLDGGKGIDTITAELSGKKLAPVMKNIEKGIFSHDGKSSVGLDLLHAQQMTDLTFSKFGGDASIKNASDVQSIKLSGMNGQHVKVAGLDMHNFLLEKISVVNSADATLDIQTKGGQLLHKIDVTLNDSQLSLHGDLSVVELAIHSTSKDDNVLNYYGDSSLASIQKVTLNGSAALDFNIGQSAAFSAMTVFNASAMDGALATKLNSDKLAYVRGGTDNDNFSINKIGGTQSVKADLDMGAGTDTISITSKVFDAKTMVLDGGKGTDTVHYSGADKGISAGFDSFENLKIENLSGTYTLNSDWHAIAISDGIDAAKDVVFKGGTALSKITAGAGRQVIQVDDLGGTTAHKATIKMGDGDDDLTLHNLSIDDTKQHFYGGRGHDQVHITGHVGDLAATFSSFETLEIKDAAGTYDMAGTDIRYVSLGNAPDTSTSFSNISSENYFTFTTDVTTLLTMDVAKAGDDIVMGLSGGHTIGNATFGMFADPKADLFVGSYGGASTLYLSTLGSQSEAANLAIAGNSVSNVIASNGAHLYLDTVHITNTAGANILGLLDGSTAFVTTGAQITGGVGNDVLVGGNGADTISGGGGDDAIHGSLGVDKIDLSAGGVDVLVFHSVDQSAFQSGDQITGFNGFKGIDLSDVVSSIFFGGNKASFNDGIATLSTNHSVGFFDTSSHTLYVDVNHDGALNSAQDMEFHFTDLDSFNAGSLLG